MRENPMNNFSKKELQELHRALKEVTRSSLIPYSVETLALKRKVHAMIDNYKCAHKSDGLIYTSNPPQNKCIYCGEFYR
jgi:t-SNARE complex subunit (syntaxin)